MSKYLREKQLQVKDKKGGVLLAENYFILNFNFSLFFFKKIFKKILDFFLNFPFITPPPFLQKETFLTLARCQNKGKHYYFYKELRHTEIFGSKKRIFRKTIKFVNIWTAFWMEREGKVCGEQ